MDLFAQVDPWIDMDTKQLFVNERLRDDPHCTTKVIMCLLICRRFINWSDTRWAKSGPASRLFIRAVGTGLDAGVKECLDDRSCNSYNLTGYSNGGPAERLLLGVAALALGPVEHFILEMLKDDRILLCGPRVHDEVVERMGELTRLPDVVWRRISQILEIDYLDYQHDVLYSMLIGYGYLWRGVYESLETEPLSWTQGDLDANADALRARSADDIKNELVKRWKGMQEDDDCDNSAIIGGWSLLIHAASSSKVIEQGHSAGQLIAKQHTTCTEKQLRVRALFHSHYPLYKRLGLDRRRAFLKRLLHRLGKSRPKRAGVRQLRIKEKFKRWYASRGHRHRMNREIARSLYKTDPT